MKKWNSHPKHTLICTVGTSLFYPNLIGLPSPENYEPWLNKQPSQDRAYLSPEFVEMLKTNWTEFQQHSAETIALQEIARSLTQLPGTTRLCGAEINSIADLITREYCTSNCKLYFCHSATESGRNIANILVHYYRRNDRAVVTHEIEDLQDDDPKRFRTKGLRNLAKTIGQIVRESGSEFCAINATGGYKAQIAIAVLMGQALGIPVYYKHERFSEIVAFPPMPISLDFELWQHNSGLLEALQRNDVLNWDDFAEDWDEKMEVMVERVEVDGQIYIELSPTGQIFHDTFKNRFDASKNEYLPPPIDPPRKIKPSLTDHGWGNAREPILNFLQTITDQCPYVRQCRTHYWNPDLSQATRFRLQSEQIEGIFSNGSWTVKFYVDTSANTSGQRAACIADLNQRLANWI
ncbi:putative CRISPR-associated protein [Lusitaniella coriacea LEGE 07157]|uniref:Putative CRISPR-associated protein n=1 Tax=Lusitaniella coriacea LEGE 07157 TaxID=945747 RepID=A0A8J7B819_9CYAN|nr:putative CRISPR-associated protein [Lusitaniella coriacea]MBE9114940.1 putative CRISPR-associated protein [Lusitaniella coriacea LEGE 07157]